MRCEICVAELGDFSLDVTSPPSLLSVYFFPQGLTHLGKGTLTLCPYHSDRQLMSQVAVAGLLTVLVSFLDVCNIILGKSHCIFYGLVAAVQP